MSIPPRQQATATPTKIGVAVFLSIVCIASVFGLWKAYSTPKTVLGAAPMVNYQHRGAFDYVVYVNPNHLFGSPPEIPQDKEEEWPLYFTNIINDIQVGFEYALSVDGPVENTTIDLEIVAIVNGPSGWQKEVPLINQVGKSRVFSVDFPLELEQFSDLVNTIETELGVGQLTTRVGDLYNLVIEARVAVAGTGSEPISDIFIQPMTIVVGTSSLRWDNNLFLSERKTIGGVSYKHQGNFTYIVELKENSLYGSDIRTLSPETYTPPQPIAIPAPELIFTRITDIIRFNFDYQFLADRPVTNLVEEVEVAAIPYSTDRDNTIIWSKTFVLVAPSQKSGSFSVDFPVDIHLFNELVSIIRNEIGLGQSTNNLMIRAVVHTTADTDYGPIDDEFTQFLTGVLGPETLVWTEELDSVVNGAVTIPQAVANPDKLLRLPISTARIAFPVVTAISLAGALYLLIILMTRKPLPLSRIEQEARQANKKHRGLIVDVTGAITVDIAATKDVPYAEDRAITVISLSSLDDLITTAENLFKPVLHEVEGEQHRYWVIDNMVRYEYISG